jgi:hypothetical protein
LKENDIYAFAADYDKNAVITKDFFAAVQSKFLLAITGKTAAEIIYDSADVSNIDKLETRIRGQDAVTAID